MHSKGPSLADKYIRDAHRLIDAKSSVHCYCKRIIDLIRVLESYLNIDLPDHIREPKIAELINNINQEAGSIMFTINYYRTPKY